MLFQIHEDVFQVPQGGQWLICFCSNLASNYRMPVGAAIQMHSAVAAPVRKKPLSGDGYGGCNSFDDFPVLAGMLTVLGPSPATQAT